MSGEELRRRIDEIRQGYEVQGGGLSPLVKPIELLLGQVSEDLYSTQFHFILELIQNAVDSARIENGVPQPVDVRFHLSQDLDELVVANNGAPFSIADIERLCLQGEVRKGHKKIGYKGIGFKSIIRVTHNPQIFSPGCHFEFDRSRYSEYRYVWLVIPHLIAPERVPVGVEDGWVTFVLPLRQDLPHSDLVQLSRELDELSRSPKVLLFIDGLEQVEIRNDHSHQYVRMRKRRTNNGLTVVERTHSEGDESWEPLGRWIVTSHRPQKPITADAQADYIKRRGLEAQLQKGEEIDIGDTRLALAFAVGQSGRFVKERGPIYAFFPVIQQESGLRFAVQADFLTTANRESLAPGAWNAWLLANIPDAVESAIEELKQKSDYQTLIYDAHPLDYEGASTPVGDKEESFLSVAQEIVTRLRRLPVVLTNRGGKDRWVLPAEAVWQPAAIRTLLDDADLSVLLPEKQAFVSARVRSKRAHDFLTKLEGLNIDQIGTEELVQFLHRAAWLETKKRSWFVSLFRYLAEKASLNEEQKKELRLLPFVPTAEGLVQADDRLFLPALEPAIRVSGARFVHKDLAKAGPEVVGFLRDTLRIPVATRATLLKGVVLPALQTEGSDLEHSLLREYTRFIAMYYDEQADAASHSLHDEIRDCMLLEAGDGVWRRSSDLCVSLEDGVLTVAGYLLKGAPTKFFVRRSRGSSLSARFLRWAGAHAEPPVALLIEALGDATWFSQKPAPWFRALYAYLNKYADDEQLAILRGLSIIPVMGQAGDRRLCCPSPIVYFRTERVNLSRVESILADDNITFVRSEILQASGKLAPFQADPMLARHFLEKLGITELKPLEVVRRLVVKRFQVSKEVQQHDARLLDYTLFALETFEHEQDLEKLDAWQEFKAAVEVKTTDGEWESPAYSYPTLYLTAAYGAHDFEALLEGLIGVRFVSPEYLTLADDKERWRKFWVKVGVREKLHVNVRNGYQNAWYDLIRHDEKYRAYVDAIMETDLDGYERWDVLKSYERHRVAGHATMEQLDGIISRSHLTRMRVLVNLLADFWTEEAGYRQDCTVQYEHRFRDWRPWTLTKKPSYFAWTLTSNEILPTTQGFKSAHESNVYRDTQEIRALVGEDVAYLDFKPTAKQKSFLADFMGVIWSESSVSVWDVQKHLRQLKAATTDTDQTARIYEFLAEKEALDLLEKEELVFLPTPSRVWWKPSALFWTDFRSDFGELRGYVSLEPAYQSLFQTFEKIGVNVGKPQARDWADLLLDIEGNSEQEHALVGRAYEMLETFWRAEPTEPEWWADFVDEVQILTENHGYLSPQEIIYIPDDPLRHNLFREVLPFVWLPDSFRKYEFLLQRLSLRRVSDPRWIEVDVQSGKVIGGKATGRLWREIVDNRPFIRSVLVHKYPDAEVEFGPLLDLLVANSRLKVLPVESLEVRLKAKGQGELAQIIEDKRSVIYSPQLETLYILATKTGDRRTVGLGVAAIFGRFEEGIRSELMLLFSERDPLSKRQLLEDDLGIPLYEALPPQPPTKDNQTAYVTVLTEPSGLAVYIDDTSIGNAPITEYPVRPNILHRVISEIGGTRVKVDCKLAPGEKRTVRLVRPSIAEPPYRPEEPTGPPPRPDTKSTERIAIEVYVNTYESKYGREIRSVTEEKQGYDVASYDPAGQLVRYIEVKSSRKHLVTCDFTDNEWETARVLGPSYWLYVVEYVNVQANSVSIERVDRHITPIQDPYKRFQDTAQPILFRLRLSAA